MEEATKIGEMLMHRNGEEFTGMTSIKSYIDPQVIVEFFQSLDLHPPKKMGIKIDKK
jgi:DNA topoisomerase IB